MVSHIFLIDEDVLKKTTLNVFQPSCQTVINPFKQSVIVITDIRLARQLYDTLCLQLQAKLLLVLHQHVDMHLHNVLVNTHEAFIIDVEGEKVIC